MLIVDVVVNACKKNNERKSYADKCLTCFSLNTVSLLHTIN